MNDSDLVELRFKEINRDHPENVGRQHEKKAVAAFQGEFPNVPKWFVHIENVADNSPLDKRGLMSS